MPLRGKGGKSGFTLIELMIVLVIIMVLASVATFTYISQIEQITLRSDVRELIGALEMAKMRAIASGEPHGVVFIRGTGDEPDAFFVYRDCTPGDQRFTDPDGNPRNNIWSDDCSAITYDPKLREGGLIELQRDDHFTTVFGGEDASNSVIWGTGATHEYVQFNNLGQAFKNGNLINGEFIFMQNQNNTGGGDKVDQVGVRIFGATGSIEYVPLTVADPV